MTVDLTHPDTAEQADMLNNEPVAIAAPGARVFVTQATNLDLVKATRFGELYPLIEQGVNVVMQPTETIDLLREGLQGYSTEDFILPTGDPVIIGLAFTIAAYYSRGHLRVLKWDRHINDYYPVRLNLND